MNSCTTNPPEYVVSNGGGMYVGGTVRPLTLSLLSNRGRAKVTAEIALTTIAYLNRNRGVPHYTIEPA